MGVTVAYRGKMAHPERLDAFQRELLDRAAELGARPLVIVGPPGEGEEPRERGVVLELHPDCEAVSVLVAPDGRLRSVHELALSEGTLPEADGWVSVKTQFAPIEVHVRLVALLDWLAQTWVPDLEVCDDGEFFETRDLDRLCGHREMIGHALGTLGAALESSAPPDDVHDDPERLADWIEGTAREVDRKHRERMH